MFKIMGLFSTITLALTLVSAKSKAFFKSEFLDLLKLSNQNIAEEQLPAEIVYMPFPCDPARPGQIWLQPSAAPAPAARF